MRLTRKHRANELMKLLEDGPSFSLIGKDGALSRAEADNAVRIWLRTWIVPHVRELVPELRPKVQRFDKKR